MGCGTYSTYLCQNCINKLSPTLPRCHICRGISNNYVTHPKCAVIHNNEFPLQNVTSLWNYNKMASITISTLKYSGVFQMKDRLKEVISQRLLEMDLTHLYQGKNIYITEIPQHRQRSKERGFEPTKIITQIFADLSNCGINIPEVLSKRRNNPKQATIKYENRKSNSEGIYICNKRPLSKIEYGSNVILVDDVITSGATIQEAARTISQKRPDIHISGLSLFKATKRTI